MLTRRITLALAGTILAVITIGIVAFAATTNEPSAALPSPTAATDPVVQSTTTENAPVITDPASATPSDPPDTVLTTEGIPAELPTIDAGEIYATHCASCHGTNGEGGSGGPVDDVDLTLIQVIDITTNGVPRMPAYEDVLTAEEIEAVSEYILTLGN